jgi:hypothetical protein
VKLVAWQSRSSWSFNTLFTSTRHRSILSHIHPIQASTRYFSKTHFNIIITSNSNSTEWSHSFRLSNQILYAFLLDQCGLQSSSPYLPYFYHLNNIWWWLQIMNSLLYKSGPWKLKPPMLKYSHQRPVLRHLQTLFFP